MVFLVSRNLLFPVNPNFYGLDGKSDSWFFPHHDIATVTDTLLRVDSTGRRDGRMSIRRTDYGAEFSF